MPGFVVRFPADSTAIIDLLANRQRRSRSEILRSMLQTYAYLDDKKEAGCKIFLMEDDKIVEEVILP